MFMKIPKEPVAMKVMRLTTPLTETSASGSEPQWGAMLRELTQFGTEWKWKAYTPAVPLSRLKAISTGAFLLPQTQGQIFAGEDFRAYLNVCNQQPAMKDSMQLPFSFLLKLKIEIWKEQESGQKSLTHVSTVYENSSPILLKPGEFTDLIFSMRLVSSGTYSIICHCECLPRRSGPPAADGAMTYDEQKTHRFRRLYKLMVEDPFRVDYHNYCLPNDNRIVCELSLTSNNEAGSLSLTDIQIKPTFPKQIKVTKLSTPNYHVFTGRNDRKIFLFDLVVDENTPQKLIEIFRNPLGGLKFEWRHRASYQHGCIEDLILHWGDEVVSSLCLSNNVPLDSCVGEDLIEQPTLLTTLKKCPNSCQVGEIFEVTYTIKNLSILEEARKVRIYVSESAHVVSVGVFPIILPLIPASGSVDFKIDYVCVVSGEFQVPILKAVCESWRPSEFFGRGTVSIVAVEKEHLRATSS